MKNIKFGEIYLIRSSRDEEDHGVLIKTVGHVNDIYCIDCEVLKGKGSFKEGQIYSWHISYLSPTLKLEEINETK